MKSFGNIVGQTKLIFFITFLRAIAACLITNSHYTGIYPTDLIANGGLIGDVLFFAVSGYNLYSVRDTFIHWYSKRLIRVYIPVLLITLLYIILGIFKITEERDAIFWFIYPTNYHFVASIILLYIPFFFIMRVKVLQKNIQYTIITVATIYLLIYVNFYNKTYYHIDNVREPMIRFLFFESMLLGAWFRQNDYRYRNQFHWYLPIITIIIFIAYFVSKMHFSKNESYNTLQAINQLLIFILLYLLFRLFCSIDKHLEELPDLLKRCISFISELTLEIYLVQHVLIDIIRPLFSFPMNWVILTIAIIFSAFILFILCRPITRLCTSFLYTKIE